MTPHTPIADAMREKLEAAFHPEVLVLEDQSHLHSGHAGAAAHAREHGSGESHFHLTIVADRFRELPRVARHQVIMEVLSEEMPRIHALSIDAREGEGPRDGGGTKQGDAPENRDSETGKSKAWANKDTTKSKGLGI